MEEHKFNPEKLSNLNNPKRLIDIPPEWVWSKLGIKKPDVLVDIGAGTAFFSVAFLELVKPSTIYACDHSDIMIDWVRENVTPQYPAIIPVKTQDHAVPLDDGIADVVYTINLHHELDDPDRTVEESYRILKPSGAVFIIDWKKEAMAQGPPVHKRCSPEQVKEQLSRAGYRTVDVFDELEKHFLVVGRRSDKGQSR